MRCGSPGLFVNVMRSQSGLADDIPVIRTAELKTIGAQLNRHSSMRNVKCFALFGIGIAVNCRFTCRNDLPTR